MGNPLICSPKLSDVATLATAATMAPSMPLSNLQKMQLTDCARFTDLSEEISFTVNLSAAMTATGISDWNFVGLFGTNLDEDAEFRVVAAASEAGLTSPSYNSGSLVFWPSPNLKPAWERVHGWIYTGATPRVETWLKVSIYNASNPATYLDIGRLYVSLAYQPALPARQGEIPTVFEEEQTIRAEGGPEYPRSDGPAIVFPLALQAIGDGAMAEMRASISALRRDRGTSRDVFAILDPDEDAYAMDGCVYGRFTNQQSIIQTGFQAYEIGLTIKELR